MRGAWSGQQRGKAKATLSLIAKVLGVARIDFTRRTHSPAAATHSFTRTAPTHTRAPTRKYAALFPLLLKMAKNVVLNRTLHLAIQSSRASRYVRAQFVCSESPLRGASTGRKNGVNENGGTQVIFMRLGLSSPNARPATPEWCKSHPCTLAQPQQRRHTRPTPRWRAPQYLRSNQRRTADR